MMTGVKSLCGQAIEWILNFVASHTCAVTNFSADQHGKIFLERFILFNQDQYAMMLPVSHKTGQHAYQNLRQHL